MAESRQLRRSAPHRAPQSERPGGSAGPEWPACGDLDMRIARDGTWFYRGSPIGRKPLVKLFSTVLKCDEDGVYWLQTPVEKGRIEVEDAPFVAVELRTAGEGRNQALDFRTNVDDWVEAGADHPIRVEETENREPSPYIHVRDRLEALIVRPVFYHLVELAQPSDDDEAVLGVWSRGTFFPLGKTR